MPRSSAPMCWVIGTTSSRVLVMTVMGVSSAGRSLRAFVEHGLVGLVLIRKRDGLVLAQGEVDVAEHLASARALALDMHRKSVAVASLVQDGAEAEHRVDVAHRNFHARHPGVRGVALA